MQGYGVSKGLCYAKALVLKDEPIVFPTKVKNPEEEEELFFRAQTAILEETVQLQEKTRILMGSEAAEILDTHCTMIKDDGIVEPIKREIANGIGAAMAVEHVLSGIIDQFSNMRNEYMSQRALDIKDIKERLIRKILNVEVQDISSLGEPTIIVGKDITPSTTAGMDVKYVVGMLMEGGGKTSHTSILARTLDIPAIVGVKQLLSEVKTGDKIAFDGSTGEIFVKLSQKEMKEFEKKRDLENKRKEKLADLAKKTAVMKDGVKINLFGNIGKPDDVKKVIEKGSEGIGLFRSEFLYIGEELLPTEDMQFEAYRTVLEKMGQLPVIVRTMDIGGDKELPALGLEKEANPFLGLRAIRLCKKRNSMFHTQLRALLRASVYGNIHIMFPMISSLDELRWAKEEVKACQIELIEQGFSVNHHIPVGIMIEIPSTAIMAEQFAKECDFFSIGTNDLTQYTLAVDRGNEDVAELYTYFHPAVLRLIKMAVEGAHKVGIPCGMCGEAAGNPDMIPLLVGMELDEYSMSASSILEAKELVKSLDLKSCKKLLKTVLRMETANEVEKAAKEFIRKRRKKEC